MLVVVAAFIGFLLGRVPGLLIGAALGYAISHWAPRLLRRGLVQVQQTFLESAFAVMGALCKADGRVSRDEIQAAEAVMDRLRLGAEQRRAAQAAFERGKQPGFDLDGEVAAFARRCSGNVSLLQMFLRVQLAGVAADGKLDQAEYDMLRRVARGLGLSEAELQRLEAMLNREGGGQATSQRKLEDAYRVLGVGSSASDAEVKRAYRRLMSQNHPDKLAGRGMPESMRELAEEKTREIGNAYDVIREARAA